MIVRIEIENPFGLRFAFLLDDSLEQLFLVLEVHIERPFGDAGGAGDVVHAGGVEALGEKHRSSAVDDLPPLGALVVGGRGSQAVPMWLVSLIFLGLSAYLPVLEAALTLAKFTNHNPHIY